MRSDGSTELETVFVRYRTAQALLRARRKPALEHVEAALAARVALFRCLVDTGWQPPEPIARQIDLDAALVGQPPGASWG